MEFAALCRETFRRPLAIPAAPAASLLLICLGAIAAMTIREFRKKQKEET